MKGTEGTLPRNRRRRRMPMAVAAACGFGSSLLSQALPDTRRAGCFVSSPSFLHQSRRRYRTITSSEFRRPHFSLARTTSITQSQTASTSQDDEAPANIAVEDLSDAEVLLACRSYLSKRKKIEWSAAERRKRAREQSAQYTAGESGTVGYFWENPEELVYLKAGGSGDKRGSGGTSGAEGGGKYLSGSDGNSGDGGGSLAMAFDGGDLWSDGVVEDDADVSPAASFDDDYFVSAADRIERSVLGGYLSGPSEEHTRRSEAQKSKWKDPKWKDEWYKRRWGEKGEKMKSDDEKAQKKLEDMVNAIPADVLALPELVEMSDADVASAVQIYLESRRKRSETNENKKREKVVTKRVSRGSTQPDDEDSAIIVSSVDFSLSDDEIARSKQQERSKRAKRAYQTRRANEENRRKEEDAGGCNDEESAREVRKPSAVPHMFAPHKVAAQQAQEQIEWALHAKTSIDTAAIDKLMVPEKMRGRKQLLLRILKERFGKEGKCIPRADGRMAFATTAPIGKLAAYIQTLLIDEQWGGR